ncbi:uncharacterized protein stbd1 [Pristis pectinata]|uniref:uncharacterized protein stbd1 n=1 Tax=Pristis pectinata TaxID=685728 RepID=UPI00223E37CF|nr:uncharacterized protein stbd1 [Pristis pectinata]
MAVGLMSIVAGLVTMFSSSWTVLPVAAVVALATWIWWSRGRNREGLETPSAVPDSDGSARSSAQEESGGGPPDGAAVKADIERANVLEVKETAELTVDVQPSPVKQKSVTSEPKVISDTMVSDQREMDLAPALSNKQDWPAVEQISNKIQTEMVTPPTSGGESPVHNTHVTEYNLGQEKRHVCEKIKPMEEALNKSDHEDEALDLVSTVDQKFVSTDNHIIQTNKVSSESNADVLIETEIEKDKRKSFKLVFKDESERTAASPESENMTKKVAAVSPLPLNNVSVSFNVHYMTCLDSQILAVTGNHECLGQWENYVPLKPNKDGFWSNSVLLPVNSRFEWKYVVVENGKIWRWEECLNRCLETFHEDMEMYQCWGYH